MFGEFIDFFNSRQREIMQEVLQHSWLTCMALFIATLLGVLTGIALSRFKQMAAPVIGLVNVIQTIPSLALLGFMLPLLGIGNVPAIVVLFLYALLPIVRNTYTGIEQVPKRVREAALAMGLSGRQLLFWVELPLAAPTIFAGIRTATVLGVGIATLCAYVAAGGLGTFIFRGIALNNTNMILAGALPAAALALFFDALLAGLQRLVRHHAAWATVALSAFVIGVLLLPLAKQTNTATNFIGGFHPEFMERTDGYPGMAAAYGLQMETVELDAGLMYSSLREGRVDVIGGYASDGRIDKYGLRVLEDDRGFFPPYYAAPLVRQQTLEKYPQLEAVFALLSGHIDDVAMRRMNYLADDAGMRPRQIARNFLDSLGLQTSRQRSGTPDIRIGGKNFTEQFILAEMLALLVDNYTDLHAETKTGLGGTQICFEALRAGEIDLYVEYTGTGLLVLLDPEPDTVAQIIRDKEAVYRYVKQACEEQYAAIWMEPLGFNNTYALMLREDWAEARQIHAISDLAAYLKELGQSRP